MTNRDSSTVRSFEGYIVMGIMVSEFAKKSDSSNENGDVDG
jgi:hypothetical protein